MNLSNIQ